MTQWLANYLAFQLFHIQPGTKLASALTFFIGDVVKIYFLLLVIVFAVAVIRSFFPPEKARRLLQQRREFVGNVLAALLGIVTPFCSCSAVPLFIGFVESGLPLGVTFSFLISSPTVNEVALVMLWALFGWRISVIYIGTGVILAIIGGILIGRLHLENQVEDYVHQITLGQSAAAAAAEPTWRDRADYGWSYTKDIFRRIWPFILIGVGLGAWIHGYAPVDFVVKYAGRGNPLAVPIAVLIAIPLYSNAAGTIPIVQALVGKGMPMGTVLAFMMAIVAISTPEMIILRKVIKPKLIGYFIGIVTVSIIIIGYLFNAILPA